MRDKWVDIDAYFGPDRRRRPGPKRWQERRRADETGKPPPLGALLRRLRVQMFGLTTPDDRRRAVQLIVAAISEAERQHLFGCADALKQAERALRLGGAGEASAVDGHLVDAMTRAGNNE